jgi:hypothetical protein
MQEDAEALRGPGTFHSHTARKRLSQLGVVAPCQNSYCVKEELPSSHQFFFHNSASRLWEVSDLGLPLSGPAFYYIYLFTYLFIFWLEDLYPCFLVWD